MLSSRVIVAAVEAFLAQNQILSRVMSGMEPRSDGPSALEPVPHGTGALTIFLAVILAAGLAAMALLSSNAAEPLVVATMALLAMAGAFFLFGLAAGHIKLAEPEGEANVAALVAANMDTGVRIASRDGQTVFSNPELRTIVGVDDNGDPRPFDVAFAGEPQAAEGLFRLMGAAERGEVRTETFRVREQSARSRAGRWLRVSVRPLSGPHNDDRLIGATLWQVADITSERAREAEAVHVVEAALAEYERLPFGLLTANSQGRITRLNPALIAWLGIGADSWQDGRLSLADLVAESGDAAMRAAFQRGQGQIARLPLDLVAEDGSTFPVEIAGRMSTADGSDAGELMAVVLPRAAESADASGATDTRFARLFQSSPFGIATLGPEGRILSSNAAFARMFIDLGLAGADSVQNLLAGTTDAEIRRSFDDALAGAKQGRSTLQPIEVSFGPEQQFTRRFYLSPIAQPNRHNELALLYVIDATEQKALELKYAQSTKMEAVGKLAGGIAHDFNNVLTAIIGFSDLLLQTHRPTDAAYKDILNIKQNANRAAGMVRQLLAFSRRQTLQPETLELGEVLTDLSILLNRLIGEKVDLKIVSGRDLWFVRADRTQFDQVIINLAVNAKDAMPEGGRLTIRTKNVTERESLRLRHQSLVPGEYVCVEVEDTGHGMTPEIMAKIFEPFFSTKDVGKGTGLGLSTVYGIVKQTGGYVFPESALGKGTTFRVYLPRHIPEAVVEVPVEKEPKKERPRDFTGSGRILLVEDEDSVRNFAARALKRQGYEVIEATTGVEALDLVASDIGHIDIVVSDVVMPEMDGPTMLRELRKTDRHLKVIFVSGYPDDRFKTGLDPDEQFAFLPKPFTLPQLAAKVKEELAR